MLTLACTLAISACAKDPRSTGSIRGLNKPIEQMSVPELQKAASVLGSQYDRNPSSKAVGVKYASVLRSTGRNEQALAVMQQVVIKHPQDNEVLSEYGKEAARIQYRKALDIVPNEPSVLSNLGMSYVLTGDLRGAETYLRRGVKHCSCRRKH